jgi:hypothetical protein
MLNVVHCLRRSYIDGAMRIDSAPIFRCRLSCYLSFISAFIFDVSGSSKIDTGSFEC